MNLGKHSSQKTPTHRRFKPDDEEEHGNEQAFRPVYSSIKSPSHTFKAEVPASQIVYSMIRSPSSTFKAEAPVQPLLKSALKDSKSKSALKSAQSGKSSKSHTKETGTKTRVAEISHFTSHQNHRDDSDEDRPKTNQKRPRSGTASVDKSHRGYRDEGYDEDPKESTRKLSHDKNSVGKRSTPKKHSSTSAYVQKERERSPNEHKAIEHRENVPGKSHKYTIIEDLEILEYVEANPEANFNSRTFWRNAVGEDELLNGTRSGESIRDRYRHYLRDLPKEEKQKMFEYHDRHYDENGYAHLKDRIVKDDHGRIQHWRRFEGIEHGTVASHHHSGAPGRKKRSASKTDTFLIDSKEGVFKPADDDDFEEEERDHREYDYQSRKRREYDSMHRFDERAISRKTLRDNYYHEEEDITDRHRGKEVWLQELAIRHMMSPEQMKSLFYNCSMDFDVLRRYLDGETDLLWSNDEDILITGTQREEARRVLSKYKGAWNVNTRWEFLRKTDRFYGRP